MKLFAKIEDNVPVVYTEDGTAINNIQDVKLERSHSASGLFVTLTFFVLDEDEKEFSERNTKSAESTEATYTIVDDLSSGESGVYVDGFLSYWKMTKDVQFAPGVFYLRTRVHKKSPNWPNKLECLLEEPGEDPPCSRPEAVVFVDKEVGSSAIYVDGILVDSGSNGSTELKEKLTRYRIVESEYRSMFFSPFGGYYWPRCRSSFDMHQSKGASS